MGAQEIIAIYRYLGCSCPDCRRIVSKYEKTCTLTVKEIDHLKNCILNRH